MLDIIWRTVAVGIGATALMDIWAIVLNRLFGLARPNWGMVGRWVWHLKDGKVFHDSIGTAAHYANETALGWAFHYAVGILYAALLVLFAGAAWLDTPTFLPAFILGMITVGAGWFLLAPGLGAGWAASKTPNPMLTRALNLVSHTVFALGLWGTSLLL